MADDNSRILSEENYPREAAADSTDRNIFYRGSEGRNGSCSADEEDRGNLSDDDTNAESELRNRRYLGKQVDELFGRIPAVAIEAFGSPFTFRPCCLLISIPSSKQ
jgi:hypothetical protein